MTTFDIVKDLCKKRGITIASLEEKVGFGKNSIYSWKKNSPSTDKLQKVADYFDVSTDFLLGRKHTPEWATTKEINDMHEYLESDVDVTYKGIPISEQSKQKVQEFMEFIYWETAEEIRKEKEKNKKK